MLKSLHIRNYVLIDSLDIEFPGGLVIITGETGAGKSILLGALSLALGGKADASAIPDGKDSCIVEAEFEVPESLKPFFEAQDIEWYGGNLIVRRTLHPSGRSRSFANDCPVSVQVLQELSERLIDIHSQHKSLMLRDKQWQLELLDNFAGCAATVQECRGAWKELVAAKSALAKALAAQKISSDEGEYNREQYRRLSEARIREGELAELEQEHLSLSHAEEILSNFEQISAICDNQEGTPIVSSLKEAARLLEKNAAYIPSMSDLSQRMESVRIELSDILEEAEQAASGIDCSRERLIYVEQRMALLYDLFKRYGCQSETELLKEKEKYAACGASAEDLEAEVAELQKKCTQLQERYSELCSRLHQSREAALEPFSANIQQSLRLLQMEKAVFKAALTPCAEGPEGTDEPLLSFSSNGTPPQDVAKCASGGEISRIMLSMKALMASYVNMPTLVFDEIDSGVSGSAAEAMGRMICKMGEKMQVLSITHLPQVAAKGDAHFVVTKKEDASGVARSSICRVEGENRIREVARLLSGATITPEALANARALMGE